MSDSFVCSCVSAFGFHKENHQTHKPHETPQETAEIALTADIALTYVRAFAICCQNRTVCCKFFASFGYPYNLCPKREQRSKRPALHLQLILHGTRSLS